MPDECVPAAPGGSEERRPFLRCAKLFSVPRGSSMPGHRCRLGGPGGRGAASVMWSDRARTRWRWTALKKAYSLSVSMARTAAMAQSTAWPANQLAEENCEALCCGGGSDGEAERDEVSGEDGAAADDRSAESCTFARGEHEKLRPHRRRRGRRVLWRWGPLGCSRQSVVLAAEVVWSARVRRQ